MKRNLLVLTAATLGLICLSLATNGKPRDDNHDRAKGARSVKVVADVRLIGQTGPLSQVVFVPETDGLYRVTAYAVPTVPNSNPSFGDDFRGHLSWTDDLGFTGDYILSKFTTSIIFEMPGRAAGDMVFHATASQPVTFVFEDHSTGIGPGNGRYNLYITAEQLSGDD